MRKRTKNKAGRPTKMTAETLGKLEYAFALDCTVEEACFYAGINPDTYYAYAKNHLEFSERVKALKQQPVLAARQKIVDGIEKNVQVAQWYLERKRKDEFSPRQEVQNDVRVSLWQDLVQQADEDYDHYLNQKKSSHQTA